LCTVIQMKCPVRIKSIQQSVSFSQKLIIAQLVNKFLTFHVMRRFITILTTPCHFTLSGAKRSQPIPSSHSRSLQLYFSSIPTRTSVSFYLSLYSRLFGSHANHTKIGLTTAPPDVSCPTYRINAQDVRDTLVGC